MNWKKVADEFKQQALLAETQAKNARAKGLLDSAAEAIDRAQLLISIAICIRKGIEDDSNS